MNRESLKIFAVGLAIYIMFLAFKSRAENTNQVDKASKTNNIAKVEKERKTEHFNNKIIIKARDKGSKKESDYKIDREFPLMFTNNKKAKKAK